MKAGLSNNRGAGTPYRDNMPQKSLSFGAKSAYIQIENYGKFLKDTNLYIGKGFFENLTSGLSISKSSETFDYNKSKFVFEADTFLKKARDGVIDITKLPVDIFAVVMQKANRIPLIRDIGAVKRLGNLPVFQARREEKETAQLARKIKGLALSSSDPFELRKTVLKIPSGRAVGNYNTKDERALNRLSTGFVSSMFVGTDFYNLVMYEKNDKKEAAQAARKRRNRELSRHVLTAFLTFSILGTFSGFINRSKVAACAAIAGCALFSEVITRLVSGVSLKPLTPEEAKKYNEKHAKKQAETAADKKEQETNKTRLPANNNNEDDRTKSPITFKNVAKAAVTIVAANILYGVARSKIPSFDKMLSDISAKYKKIYKSIAKADLIQDDKTLREFLDGFTGRDMGAIRQAYSRILNVKFTREEAQQLLQNAQNGVVSIDNKSKLLIDAYKRSAKQDLNAFIKTAREEGIDYSVTSKLVKHEIDNVTKLDDAGNEVLSGIKGIDFKLDLSMPDKIIGGKEYYSMKDAVYNFGAIEERKRKVVLDAICYPFKAFSHFVSTPTRFLKTLAGIPNKEIKKPEKYVSPDLGEFYRDCSVMFKKYKTGKISLKEFHKYIQKANTDVFDKEGTPQYPQTVLANVSRTIVTLITSYFFVNDFRNEVLIQSNGENTQKAAEVTKERIAHKVSNFFLNKFYMNLFNNTFEKQFLGSLLGATSVAAATELTNETSVRLSIGVPVTRKKSKEDIEEFEKNHIEKEGALGAYYKLMARITGKKMLSEKANG